MKKFFLKATTPDERNHLFEINEDSYVVGRRSSKEPHNKCSVQGDPSLSRNQFIAKVEDGNLRISPCPNSKNQTGFQGLLRPGGSFMAARTRFRFFVEEVDDEDPTVTAGPQPTELALTPEARVELRQGKAARCLEIMTHFFPRLRDCNATDDLFEITYELLHELLPKTRVAIIDHNQRIGDPIRPSRGLLQRAHETGQTILHVWDGNDNFTRALGTEWALAVPIPGSVTLYAEGKDSTLYPGLEERILLDLVGETLSHHVLWRRLETVGRFLSPTVRDLVYGPKFEELLAPRLAEVTVLYFDLRGSSRAVERDNLAEYHATLTELMTRLTDCIFREEGTVIDYVGDAVLACWGAPLDQPDHAERAVRAATAVQREVREMGKYGGVGLASGKVMAGQVGARGQVKYGLIGKAPNLAARLEGLTKLLGTPVLLSDNCRRRQTDGLFRKIIKVRPAGMDDVVAVHELVLSLEDGGSGMDRAACQAFEAGQWRNDDPVALALGKLGISSPDHVLELLHK